MRRPDQLALKHAATGRISMPFLPTLVMVAGLGLASLFCPSSNPPSPEAQAELSVPAAPDLSPTAFATVAPVPAHPRRPAFAAFAEFYPLDAPSPAQTAAPPRSTMAGRTPPQVAVAGRRPCPGRRCPETPRLPDPLAAAHAEAVEPDRDGLLPPLALPFADTVAERLAPAVQAVGDAADLVRDGAAAVKGSVALAVAGCLR